VDEMKDEYKNKRPVTLSDLKRQKRALLRAIAKEERKVVLIKRVKALSSKLSDLRWNATLSDNNNL
jgi:hypothetical protein